MANRRLEYEPLKTVLQYLEPNLRIQLAYRSPSLRNVEKVVPMKIENLVSGDFKIVINDTTRIGIYRDYHNPSQTPRFHREEKERGGYERDIDQWGFLTNPYDVPLTDGDIDLTPMREPWDEGDSEMEEIYIDIVVVDQEALRRLAIKNGVVLETDYIIPELRNLPNSDLLISQSEESIQRNLDRTAESLQFSIDYRRSLLLPYYYRRHNILPPYTPLLQLTISGPNGKVTERVNHSKRLYEAMKYLSTMIFGENRPPIHVKKLTFFGHSFPHRLPKGLRIRTKQIHSYLANFQKLDDLILPDSYPLDILIIESGMKDSNKFEQEVIKSAKKLAIFNHCYEAESWVPLVQKMKNQCIILKNQTELHVPQHCMDLIESWLVSERTKGTNLSIGFRQLDTVMELLNSIKSQFEVIKMSEGSLTLPMINGSRLLISCEQAEENSKESRNDAPFWEVAKKKKSNWTLKLIVL